MAKIRAKNEPGIQERIGLDNYCHSYFLGKNAVSRLFLNAILPFDDVR